MYASFLDLRSLQVGLKPILDNAFNISHLIGILSLQDQKKTETTIEELLFEF